MVIFEEAEMETFLGKLAVWFELRAETRYFMGAMDEWMKWLFIVIVLLVGISYLDKVLDPRFRNAIVLASLMGAITPGLLARGDLLIHRPAPAVAALEDQLEVPGWENYFKPQMKPMTALLSPLDALLAIPLVFLFWYATRESSTYLGYIWFMPLMWIVHLGGWGMLVRVLTVGGKLSGSVK